MKTLVITDKIMISTNLNRQDRAHTRANLSRNPRSYGANELPCSRSGYELFLNYPESLKVGDKVRVWG